MARPAPLTPGQDQLRLRPYRIRPLAPFAVGPTTAGLILGTRSRGVVTGGVHGDEFFLHSQLVQQGLIHLFQRLQAQAFVGPIQRGMVRHPCELQRLAYPLCSQQPFLHVAVAQLQSEHQQDASRQLGQRIAMRAFGMGVTRQHRFSRFQRNPCHSYKVAFSLCHGIYYIITGLSLQQSNCNSMLNNYLTFDKDHVSFYNIDVNLWSLMRLNRDGLTMIF